MGENINLKVSLINSRSTNSRFRFGGLASQAGARLMAAVARATADSMRGCGDF